MIPLKDDTPRFSTPFITYFLIMANTIVFLFQWTLPERAQEIFVFQFGLTPSLVIAPLQPGSHVPIEVALLPFLTSMFLHSGWLHLISNMWALWIFGDNIEDYLGHFVYLLMYLAGGIVAALTHTFFNWGSNIPSVGASGAIAAVMGAYFVLYPRARVLTLVPFLFVFFLWLPAWVVLGFWFVGQFLSGAATSLSAVGHAGGGIAFWAHVGGFVFGLLIIRILPGRTRRYRYGR
jgi:membrane associated rhomboid family serine protease